VVAWGNGLGEVLGSGMGPWLIALRPSIVSSGLVLAAAGFLVTMAALSGRDATAEGAIVSSMRAVRAELNIPYEGHLPTQF
jgi:hypothetical protein